MKNLLFLTLLLTMLFLGAVGAEAANQYVRAGATGANNGSDWTNAYTTLPATLTRGNTYYIADGSYGDYTFDDANSGATLITIKKATIADHGTATGWNDTFGDGQATWTCASECWAFTTSYWTVTGVVGEEFGSTPYGFVVHNTNLNGSYTIGLISGTHNFVTLDHVEVYNNNTYVGDVTNLQNLIYAPNGGNNLTVTHGYWHDHNGSAAFLLSDWSNVTFAYNYTSNNYHKELLVARRLTNTTWKFNVSRNASGTGPWTFESPNGVYFYGNVYYTTDSRYGNNDCLICVPNGWSSDSANVNVFNNTWHNPYVQNANNFGGWPACGTCRAANNLFYNVNTMGGGNGWTFKDYSWCAGSFSCAGVTSEANDQVGSGDPFVNLAGGNFRLSAATAAGYTGITSAWANGASDYNQDRLGNIRGADGVWDRGALEFGGGVADPPPQAPTNVRVQ